MTTKKVLLFMAMLLSLTLQAQDWKDISVLQKNRESATTLIIPFKNNERAKSLEIEQSEYYKLLNGKWKFNYADGPGSRPKLFFQTDYNDSDWNDIIVPGNWEIQGFGMPMYINHPFDFSPRKNTNPSCCQFHPYR